MYQVCALTLVFFCKFIQPYNVIILFLFLSVFQSIVCSTFFFAVPNNKHKIGVVYHVFVSFLHTKVSVFIADNVNRVCGIANCFISLFINFLPFQILIGAGDCNFKSDVRINGISQLNDNFGEIGICSKRTAGDKMLIIVGDQIDYFFSKSSKIELLAYTVSWHRQRVKILVPMCVGDCNNVCVQEHLLFIIIY